MSDTISNALDHAKLTGDGTRAAIIPQPAPKKPIRRNVKVTVRSPFLPDHPQAVHGLRGRHKGPSRR